MHRRNFLAAMLLVPATGRAGGLGAPEAAETELPDGLSVGDLRTADLVFQTSKSGQSNAILWATKSPFTHCGLIRIYRGEAFVIEAAGKVRIVTLASWIARGRLGRCLIKRAAELSDADEKAVWKASKRYLGRAYDSLFLLDNRSIYCSELCWLAFKDGVDRELGQLERVRDLDVDNPLAEAVFAPRYKKHPACQNHVSVQTCRERVLDQRLITPASLANDPTLTTVFSNYLPI